MRTLRVTADVTAASEYVLLVEGEVADPEPRVGTGRDDIRFGPG